MFFKKMRGGLKMPVQVEGLINFRKSLRQIAPDLARQMDSDVKKILSPIVKDARDLVPSTLPGLSQWQTSKKVAPQQKGEARKFPLYNSRQVRSGIVASAKVGRPNSNGFAAVYTIRNNSAAGAIMETSGRKNPSGQPWVGRKSLGDRNSSHSRNPNAGLHFINSMSGKMVGNGKMRGRLIYRAWYENDRNTVQQINVSIEKTLVIFENRLAALQTFRNAA